jgi:hypothetical protein
VSLRSFFCIAILIGAVAAPLFAQPKPKDKKPGKEQQPKADLFTLRYKPQAGTLYYDVETVINHNLEERFVFPIKSIAQLALETKDVDYTTQYWTYDYYYRELKTVLSKLQLPNASKDSVLNEVRAIGKKTRVTYSMVGSQVNFRPIDTARLSGEAQFFSYFFRPPRLLAPLPTEKVTYGATWKEHRLDTVKFVDTVGIEQFVNGITIYDLSYEYKFEGLADTVDGSVAIISTKQTGTFTGAQYNPSGDRIDYSAPITGSDTTYLDLRTGRVVSRETLYSIPVKVTAEGRPPTSDLLDVRSTVRLNTSNIRSTGTRQEQ